MADSLYVQYGCHFCAPEGWLNFDASPTLRFERLPIVGGLYTKNDGRFPDNVLFGDIRKGLPVPSSSCAGVYASHVLEHLALEDFRIALVETRRILRSDGIFRAVVPDLEELAREYLSGINRKDPTASFKLMRNSYLGLERRPRSFWDLLVDWLGNSKHLWMWDFYSLEGAMREQGFTKIRRATFNDSSDPMFLRVEDEGRFVNACAIEASVE